MAFFANNDITDAGRILLSEVQMGAVFTPTRIVMGSGSLPAGITTRTITNVVNPIKSLNINKKRRSNDGMFILGGVYTNQDVTESFYFRELGVYAKAVRSDGTETAEILYCYGNAGSAADLMPAYSTGTVVERQIDLVSYIGNDTEVDLTVESGVFMTQEQMAAAIDNADGCLVVIESGTALPVAQRKEGYFYFASGSSRTVEITPGMLLEIGGE